MDDWKMGTLAVVTFCAFMAMMHFVGVWPVIGAAFLTAMFFGMLSK